MENCGKINNAFICVNACLKNVYLVKMNARMLYLNALCLINGLGINAQN